MKKEPSTENLSPLLRRSPLFMLLGSLYGPGASRFYPPSHGHRPRLGPICLTPPLTGQIPIVRFSPRLSTKEGPKMAEQPFLSSMQLTWREEDVVLHVCDC